MEYVTVTTRLWKDRWVRGLGTDAKLLWLYLITHDSDYGFYEYDPEAWALETGLDTLVIENLLFSFEADGKVARDKDLILVVKALQHRRLSTRDYDYAVNAIRKRYSARSSRLVSLCVTMNPMDSSGVHGTPLLSVSESVSDHNQNPPSIAPDTARQKPPRRGKPRAIKPEPEKYLALAAELIWFIGRKIEAYNVPHGGLANDVNAAARELRLLIEADGFDEHCILPALDWAWNDQWQDKASGKPVRYGQFLLSIEQWRPEKFRKMFTKWQANTGGDIAGGDALRTKIRERMQCQPTAS